MREVTGAVKGLEGGNEAFGLALKEEENQYGFLSKTETGQIWHFKGITEALVYRTDQENWASER